MIYRIRPSKDSFITNERVLPSSLRMTSSNVGASEELQVFKSPPISGAIGDFGTSSLGRTLIQFDLSGFTALTASGDLQSSGLSFRLRLNHKTHGCTQPSSFDVTISPLSASWDEGTGHDVDDLGDVGFCNWVSPSQGMFWSSPGGDVLDSPTASFHFDTGYEDLDVDVTEIVNGWLDGTIPNNGLLISMTASVESDSNFGNYYVKKFYSRQSDYVDRTPYIEVRSTDRVGDDRANMSWARTGTLYMYNIVGGLFQDLPVSSIQVNVSDSSGTLLTLTASHEQIGIYGASFALPTGSYSGSVFYDSWGSGSFALFTGSFTISQASPVQTVSQNVLTARIRNMQPEYLPEDVPVFEVLFRKKAHTFPVLQTASLAPVPYVVENAYYAIENDATRERVVPFGTGSQQHTRLSYGGSGNSFRFFMSNLSQGNVYRVVLLVKEQGRSQIIDPGFRFKVV